MYILAFFLRLLDTQRSRFCLSLSLKTVKSLWVSAKMRNIALQYNCIHILYMVEKHVSGKSFPSGHVGGHSGCRMGKGSSGLTTALLALWLMFALCGGAGAQQTMTDVWKRMPDSLLVYVSQNNRLDFVDFLESKMKAEVKTGFEDKSEMTELTDSYLRLQLSPLAILQMKLLPVTQSAIPARKDSSSPESIPVRESSSAQSDSSIVCVVKTVCAPDTVSTIAFYDVSWHPLQAQRMVYEQSEYMREDVRCEDEGEPLLVGAWLDAVSDDLLLTFSKPMATDGEKQKIWTKYPPKKLKWDGFYHK